MTSAVHGDIPAFHVYGRLDHRSAAHLGAVLAAAVGEPSVLVDLSDVALIDHAGLEAVIGAADRVRESGGCVAVAVTSPAVAAALVAGGMSRAVHVSSTSIEALGWLDAGRGDGRSRIL